MIIKNYKIKIVDSFKYMTELPQKNSFINIIFRDLNNFLNHFLGDRYSPKNNFSHKQKVNILSYLYYKNYSDMNKPGQKFYHEKDFSEKMNLQETESYLKNLDEIDYYNRIFLISTTYECQKRVGKTGSFMFSNI